ncbi:MAG: hypothetical protein L0K82_01385 [Pisciglobus halotolerans]|nr:hypothetical protein [Pisciglobus halotolerans]
MTDSFKELEKTMSKYKFYLKEAQRIEMSVRFPTKIVDNNIGGGKGTKVYQDESMLKTMIRLEEHEQLQRYIALIKAIEDTYAELPDYLQQTMKEFYINREGIYRGLPKRTAAKLNVDVKTLYRWRVQIAETFRLYKEIEVERYETEMERLQDNN